MSAKTQGGKACRTGSVLEATLPGAFERHNFTVLPYKEYMKLEPPRAGDFLIRRYPYESIYGHKGHTEFLARSDTRNLNVRIECKWQQSGGSVDEKFPYLFQNSLKVPEQEIILLVDGDGYKKCARDWLVQSAKACTSKIIHVFDLKEFLTWLNNRLG